MAKERFGVEKAKVRREPPKPNRQPLIENLRRKLRQLKRRYRQSPSTERPGHSELRDTVRTQLKYAESRKHKGENQEEIGIHSKPIQVCEKPTRQGMVRRT